MQARQRRLIGSLGIAALLASALLNLHLYREVGRWMRLFNLTRLNPLGSGEFTAVEAASGEEPLILFFGDSRARSWPAPSLAGAAFANRGVNGHTTVQCLLRFEEHVTPLQPDIVIIQAGINDLVAIALLPGERDALIQQTAANLARLAERARATGATVIVTTIFPAGDVPLAQWPFWSEEIERAVAEVNRQLAALAAEGIIVFDTSPVLVGDDGRVQPRYAEDELHLNAAGYEALNAALLPLLQAQLAR
jgi:lysophospholipase L1-like esterase